MRVLLDDRAIEIEPVTIARAIEVARDAALADGRIVIEVLGDGRSVEPTLLDDPPENTGGFAELKLVTADPGAFVSVTLSDAAAVLDDAGLAQQAAADEVLAGRVEGALDPLQKAFLAWSVVHDVVDKSASLLGIDARGLTLENGTGAEAIDGLADRLTEIKRALTEQDTSALSDVLAYDMPEQIENWRALLGAMERTASGRAG